MSNGAKWRWPEGGCIPQFSFDPAKFGHYYLKLTPEHRERWIGLDGKLGATKIEAITPTSKTSEPTVAYPAMAPDSS